MKIAITGGIGSGKSHVADMLRERGIQVYDCDRAAKRLMNTPKLRQQLTTLLGEDAYYGDGRLNKAVVSQFIMQSEQNRLALGAIVHPAVAEDFLQSGLEWMESAILFESGFHNLVDKVVCLYAPMEVRLQRIMQRDNITRQQAMQWIQLQLSQEEMLKRSDYCILNYGRYNLIKQLSTLITILNDNPQSNNK
ncbi:MAG: dephospho-CoA kinase [Bacteroidaceae bacterium]|nr:dephospho-CoA kinase [Bacteroidaceae bacterium]